MSLVDDRIVFPFTIRICSNNENIKLLSIYPSPGRSTESHEETVPTGRGSSLIRTIQTSVPLDVKLKSDNALGKVATLTSPG